MEVRDVNDAQEWDAFVAAQPEAQFVQSWDWGEFQKREGKRIWRLGVFEGQSLLGVMLIVSTNHPFSIQSLYVPRGPILDATLPPKRSEEACGILLHHLKQYGLREHAIFLRVDPPFTGQSPLATFVSNLPGLQKAPSLQPSNTLVLDLTLPLETLLAATHQKTRYNIRLAERKEVTVSVEEGNGAVDEFLRLQRITAKRDGITVHSDAHYRQMLESLADGEARLFIARHDGHALAANIVISFGDTVTYLHGASSNEERNLMPTQLLQWHQIRWAREEGAHWYDFWGIAPNESTASHSWAGITRFKRGFGGEERHYVGGFEYPISRFWHMAIRARRKLRS